MTTIFIILAGPDLDVGFSVITPGNYGQKWTLMDSSFWIKRRYFVREEVLFVDVKNWRQMRELYDVKYDKEWGGNQSKEMYGTLSVAHYSNHWIKHFRWRSCSFFKFYFVLFLGEGNIFLFWRPACIYPNKLNCFVGKDYKHVYFQICAIFCYSEFYNRINAGSSLWLLVSLNSNFNPLDSNERYILWLNTHQLVRLKKGQQKVSFKFVMRRQSVKTANILGKSVHQFEWKFTSVVAVGEDQSPI